MSYRKLLLTVITTLFCGVISAQTSKENNTYLFFIDALRLSQAQNLTMKAHEYEMKALRYDKKAQGGLRSPQFNLTGNFTMMDKPVDINLNEYKSTVQDYLGKLPQIPALKPIITQLMSAPWQMNIQEDQFAVLGVSMIMPIYMGGKINAANRAAKIRIEQGENKYNQELGALCSELSERYFGLSLAQQVLSVREEVVCGMKEHYYDAVALEKNGIIAKGERLYAEMFLERSIAEKQKSSRDVISINAALENTLNAKANYHPITSMFILSDIEPMDYFIASALEKSPLLKEVGFTKRLAEEQAKAKRAEILPTISAIGAANLVDYNVTHSLPKAFIGVSVNYKLFNGARNIHEYKSSKATIKRVEILQSKAKMDIATYVEKSYNDLISIGEQVQSYNSTIRFANEYLRIKVKAFHEGVGTSSDVVDAQLNLAKSKIEQIQLTFQYDVEFAKLLETCGISERYPTYMVGVTSQTISYK